MPSRGMKFGNPWGPQGVNTEGAQCMWGTFCFYWGPCHYSLTDKHSHCQHTHLAPIVTLVSDLSTSQLALSACLVFNLSGILILSGRSLASCSHVAGYSYCINCTGIETWPLGWDIDVLCASHSVEIYIDSYSTKLIVRQSIRKSVSNSPNLTVGQSATQ